MAATRKVGLMIGTVTPDEDTQVDVAVADLRDRFPEVGPDRIESTVRRLVHEWFLRARITTFVGIIAGRQARAELVAVDPAAAGPHRDSCKDDAVGWVTPQTHPDPPRAVGNDAWVSGVSGVR